MAEQDQIQDIQVLRALAILTVLAQHLSITQFLNQKRLDIARLRRAMNAASCSHRRVVRRVRT